jgi:hypothetical protein
VIRKLKGSKFEFTILTLQVASSTGNLEQFMMKLVQTVDKENSGSIGIDKLSKGLKEYLMKKIIDNY